VPDVLENVPEPFWWQRRWAGLSRRGRRLSVLLAVLGLFTGGTLWWQDRAAERDLRQRVVLSTTLGVWTSSTSPPGGAVGWFVLVRNDGRQPVTVTAVEATGDRLRIRTSDDGGRLVPPGEEVEMPVSVRLTCGGEDTHAVRVEVAVRREDGGPVTRRSELADASLVQDVATTLCSVRPDLRDHELSGPVLRAGD
jgi:hypothetical protein